MMWFLAPILLAASSSIAAADDPTYACHAPAADTKLALSFRPDISIGDLTAWITGVTCKNIVYDATIAKRAIKVTIVAPNKYTPKQALELVIDAIESTGLVVVQKPDTLVIKLGPGMPKACPDIAAAPELSKDPAPTPEPDAAALAAKLDAGIKKLDDTHYE
ncbi:MAG: hypothetical protein ABI867_19410, partial [Kofleriaceae bacterium]